MWIPTGTCADVVRISEKAKAGMIAKAALKKVVTAAEMAEMCVLLLTGAASMTGEVVFMDAGVHLA